MSFGDSIKDFTSKMIILLYSMHWVHLFCSCLNFFQSKISYNQLDRIKSFKTDRYQSSTRNTFAFSSWNNITNSNGYNGLRLSDAGF